MSKDCAKTQELSSAFPEERTGSTSGCEEDFSLSSVDPPVNEPPPAFYSGQPARTGGIAFSGRSGRHAHLAPRPHRGPGDTRPQFHHMSTSCRPFLAKWRASRRRTRVSIVYTFDKANADAPPKRNTQHLEIRQ